MAHTSVEITYLKGIYMKQKIKPASLRYLLGFAKHLLKEGQEPTPPNDLFAGEMYCTTVTINNRINELVAAGYLDVKRWTVPGPSPFKRKITVSEKGISLLLELEPDFMRSMGFKKDGKRRAKG